jgi:hypothetical protein
MLCHGVQVIEEAGRAAAGTGVVTWALRQASCTPGQQRPFVVRGLSGAG